MGGCGGRSLELIPQSCVKERGFVIPAENGEKSGGVGVEVGVGEKRRYREVRLAPHRRVTIRRTWYLGFYIHIYIHDYWRYYRVN